MAATLKQASRCRSEAWRWDLSDKSLKRAERIVSDDLANVA